MTTTECTDFMQIVKHDNITALLIESGHIIFLKVCIYFMQNIHKAHINIFIKINYIWPSTNASSYFLIMLVLPVKQSYDLWSQKLNIDY